MSTQTQTALQLQEPNLFELQGSGATITYSTSSIACSPQFSYQDDQRSVNRSGNEIRVE